VPVAQKGCQAEGWRYTTVGFLCNSAFVRKGHPITTTNFDDAACYRAVILSEAKNPSYALIAANAALEERCFSRQLRRLQDDGRSL
jgi:hypothetical protein